MRRFILAVVVLWMTAGCGTAPASESPTLEPTHTAPRAKLFVPSDGIYRVTAADLQGIGADPTQLDAATLQLFRGERAIPLRLLGEGKDLAFEFYGQASDSPFSAFGVYWLTWGAAPGARMREANAAAARAAPAESFTSTLRFSRSNLYTPQFGEAGAPWFWQAIAAPMTATFPLTLPAAIAAPAHVTIELWASTQDPVSPDHRLHVFFNDVRVAEESWDGQGARRITATIPANAVRAGANALRLAAPGDTRAQVDIVLLRSIQVTYARRFLADADALEFEGGAGTYRLEGFSGDAIDLFDITEPAAPIRITDTAIAARTLTFASDAAAPRRWLAVGPNARSSVARLAPMTRTNLRAPDVAADYLIIAHPNFLGAIQPLVKWREQRGWRVRVVTTEQVYNEFGYGEESPLAIRAFLEWARREWHSPALRFVLLVGKASYDYRDDLHAPNKNLLPTFLVETPHLRQAASDNWFVTSDDQTGRPALAIGRIPAKTTEQVSRIVNKTIAYESATNRPAWRARALFVADDKDSSFVTMADMFAQRLPAEVSAQKIYLGERQGDVQATRAEIVKQWNAGALLLVYIGHGSIDTWAEGPLFSTEHLGEIKNGERLPILVTPTCLDGFFYHPQKDSLAEALLFESEGGIVAGLVPTGLSMPGAQETLMTAFFAEWFSSPAPTLGEAMLRAKQKVATDAPDVREVIETFGLLGDPALAAGR